MAQKYLGDYFDIHCGGEDHIPVHHTNEIAQTEARVGTRLANFWMHGYFLLSNDAKMAKSAGEFLRDRVRSSSAATIRSPIAICASPRITAAQLNFTWDALDAAADRRSTGCGRASTRCAAHDRRRAPDAALTERFTNEINDDLNVPRALAVAWETLRGDSPPAVKRATLLRFDKVFGLAARANGCRRRKRRRTP